MFRKKSVVLVGFVRRRNSAAAAVVVVAVVSAVVLVVAAGTGVAVASLLMLGGTRWACFDCGGMEFGHVEMQTMVAGGKRQIHLVVAEVQLEGDWEWLRQRDQRPLNAGSGVELSRHKGGSK